VEVLLSSEAILAASNGAADAPHNCEKEHLLISQFLIFLAEILNLFEMLIKKSVDDSTSRHDLNNLVCWGNVFQMLKISVVLRKEFLERSEEDTIGNIINWLGFFEDGVLGRSFVGHFIVGTIEPRVHVWFPTNICAVDVKHTTSGYSCKCCVFKISYFKKKPH